MNAIRYFIHFAVCLNPSMSYSSPCGGTAIGSVPSSGLAYITSLLILCTTDLPLYICSKNINPAIMPVLTIPTPYIFSFLMMPIIINTMAMIINMSTTK